MIATARLFKPAAADAAREADASHVEDGPEYSGEEFHRLGFGEAVERGSHADYRYSFSPSTTALSANRSRNAVH
ncbi:MAG: hypothetical protein M3P53_04280 [Actinomycetota bacterium]|nr:hypothetical protein [Actinomycetota bacterium]